MCFGEYEGFCISFCIVGSVIVMLIEDSAEKFEGDSAEQFFLIVTDEGQDTMCRLVNVF